MFSGLFRQTTIHKSYNIDYVQLKNHFIEYIRIYANMHKIYRIIISKNLFFHTIYIFISINFFLINYLLFSEKDIFV